MATFVSLAVSDLVIAMVVLLKYFLDELTLRTSSDVSSFNITDNSTDMYYGDTFGQSHTMYCFHLMLRSISVSAMNITLLNLLGMSIDHHIAINRPLSYTRLMSPRRTSIMIAIFAMIGPILGFSDMLLEAGHTILVMIGIADDKHFYDNKFCDRVDVTPYHDEYAVMIITIVCMTVMTAVYINICIAVRRLSKRARMRRSTISGETPDSMSQATSQTGGRSLTSSKKSRAQARAVIKGRSNKAIATTALLLIAFALCWVPLETFQIYMLIHVDNLDDLTLAQKVEGHLLNLTLLNTVIDPFIYALRMHEVRVGYRRLWNHVTRVFNARRMSLNFAWKETFTCGNGVNGGQVSTGHQRRYFKKRSPRSLNSGTRRAEHMELMKKNSLLSNDASTVVVTIKEDVTFAPGSSTKSCSKVDETARPSNG